MSTDIRVRLGKARMMLAAVHRELGNAIALAANLARCANSADVLCRMNEDAAGASFAIIRDALHMTLIQTLMRLNDWHRDASSIPNVLRILDDRRILSEIKAENAMRQVGVESQLAAIDAIKQTDDYKVCLVAARSLRDQYIAHAEFAPGDHGARWGQEQRLLGYTIQIAQHLEIALTSEARVEDYDHWKDYYQDSADRFWSHVASPAQDSE